MAIVNNLLESNETNFELQAAMLVEAWLISMYEKQYEDASKLCTDFIENYGSAFNKRVFEVAASEYDKLLVLLVLVKGLHEYIELCQTTKCRSWHENNLTVEQVWFKLCDCEERLNFVANYCQSTATEKIFQDLEGLKNFFQEAFGSGTYLSPGMIADKNLCSICHRDARACSHVEGRLYDGRVCFYQPVNPQANHVAIVKIPKDPRCRIWSWRVKDNDEGEGVKFEAPVLSSFRVDNFLQEIGS